VLLRPITRKLDDVAGCLSRYRKPSAASVEQMNAAIGARMAGRK
jgi:hypothetical protein